MELKRPESPMLREGRKERRGRSGLGWGDYDGSIFKPIDQRGRERKEIWQLRG